MTNKIYYSIILVIAFGFFSSFVSPNDRGIVGKWKTVDDETGEARSIIELYEKNGKVFGKIVQILGEDVDQDALCTECKGSKKNQKIVGMEIVMGMEKDGDEWEDGEIMDPESGKTYDCEMALEGENKLKVRGFLGFSLLGRTQYWYRVN